MKGKRSPERNIMPFGGRIKIELTFFSLKTIDLPLCSKLFKLCNNPWK